MIFKKPDMKYTEMAMYVDEKVNSSKDLTEDELENIYIYLYHLARMLAYKKKYFNKSEYYDDFSLMVASDMMNRLIYNPKLKQKGVDGNQRMGTITSCLNYMKAILYGRKVDFEQQNYSQKFTPPETHYNLTEYSFERQIKETKLRQVDSNIKLYMGKLGKTIEAYINKHCIYKDSVIKKNIRISCYLSLLNSIVFTQKVVDDVANKYKTPEAKFNYLCSEYELNRDGCVVLYHLPNDYYNYVTIMIRNVFALIENDLKELSVGDTYISDSILADIALAEIDGRSLYDD